MKPSKLHYNAHHTRSPDTVPYPGFTLINGGFSYNWDVKEGNRKRTESMKKALLIIGIVIIVACVISLALALLFRYSYFHVLDGSAELYARLNRRMVIAFVTSVVFAAAAVICFIARARL